MIALDAAAATAIREHGRSAYPEECCGILLGRVDGDVPTVLVARPVANVHDGERRRRFLVDPQEYLAAERAARAGGLDVLGFYHSHPDHPPEPSAHDRANAWPNLHYVILGVAGGEPGEMTSWLFADDRTTMRPERLATRPDPTTAPDAAAPAAASLRDDD